MDEPLVAVRDLVKGYAGRRVLDGVSFDVLPGEVLGVLGRNGAGKTTTVEVLQGLRARDGGEVSVVGRDPARHRTALRGLVGSQLQSCALPDRLRVDEALRLFARLAGDVVDWRSLRAEWGLADLGRSSFGDLSGGERQRLFVALALVGRPRLVFLDELGQGLDPVARRATWRLVERVRDLGTTVVLVTHDMEEAEHLCDRVVVLHGGRVVAHDRPAALVAATGGRVRLGFSAASESLDGLGRIPGVREVRHDGRRADVHTDPDAVLRVAAELARRGVVAPDLVLDRPRLEDALAALTGQRPEPGAAVELDVA